MHSLLFLNPGHFHAALTLRVPQSRAADEVFVYAREGAELRDFLALVERFNRRSPNPTRWRPLVTTDDDPLGRLVDERRGDVVVLAGRNGARRARSTAAWIGLPCARRQAVARGAGRPRARAGEPQGLCRPRSTEATRRTSPEFSTSS
jgi:hypothetical protein